MRRYMSKPNLIYIFNLLVWCYFLVRLPWQLKLIYNTATNFSDFYLIEFMSNYQGGFLRRGLFGQLLYWFTSVTHLDFRWLAFPLALGAFIWVVIFIVKKFRQYKIHLWLLPMSYCLGASYLSIIRKDFIVILIFAIILYCYKSEKLSIIFKYVLILVATAVVLLMYEPAFFMYIPIIWITICSDKGIKKWYRISYTVLVVSLMAILTLKGIGNPQVAELMHLSWYNLMPDVIPVEMSANESFLGWSFIDSLRYNGSVFYSFGWTSELYKIIVLIVTPYIFMRYPFVAAYGEKRFPCSYGVWSAVILFQILSQLPLWLGLSIDFGRMFMHVFVTSALYVFIMPTNRINEIFSFKRVRFIDALNKGIDRLIPNNIFTISIIMLFFGMYYYGYNFHDGFTNSILGAIPLNLYSYYLEFIVA